MTPSSPLWRRLYGPKAVEPCGRCRNTEVKDFVWIEEKKGWDRCPDCLRGRLQRKVDQVRAGKQVEQKELELG